jgi:hypothetical protein
MHSKGEQVERGARGRVASSSGATGRRRRGGNGAAAVKNLNEALQNGAQRVHSRDTVRKAAQGQVRGVRWQRTRCVRAGRLKRLLDRLGPSAAAPAAPSRHLERRWATLGQPRLFRLDGAFEVREEGVKLGHENGIAEDVRAAVCRGPGRRAVVSDSGENRRQN